MSQPIATRFARFAINHPEIPEEVLHAADRAILDTIGSMVVGGVHETSVRLKSALSPGTGRSTLVTGGGSDSETAAFVNGTAAHVWDMDDTSYTGLMHGSAVVLPAVLAVGQEIGSDAHSIRRSFVVGSEISYVLAEICTHSHYFRGWWSTGTFGVIGATAAVGLLFGLSENQLISAIGLAAASAGSARSMFGTDGKPLLVGESARRAVTFARLAKAGLQGPHRAFEDEHGYINLLNGGKKDIQVLESIGIRWRLVDPGLLFKSSPVCSAAHAGIELLNKLITDANADADQVAEVHAEVPELVHSCLVFSKPESSQQAQFSLPYALACSAVHGRVRFEDLGIEEIQSEKKVRFMSTVTVERSEDLSSEEMQSRFPESTRLTIKFKNGESAEGFCGTAKGMPENPLTDQELISKFENSLAHAGRDGLLEAQLGCDPTETIARLAA